MCDLTELYVFFITINFVKLSPMPQCPFIQTIVFNVQSKLLQRVPEDMMKDYHAGSVKSRNSSHCEQCWSWRRGP